MSADRIKPHYDIRLSPNHPKSIKKENQELKHSHQILEESSAFHAIFSLSEDQDSINFSYQNPALQQESKPSDEKNSKPNLPDFLTNKIRSVVTNNDWSENHEVTFITSADSSEGENSKVYGLTVKKIGNNEYLLNGRNITDKEIIRQQKEYELTHDPQTGYLNSIGWKNFCEAINHEKRKHLKPKKITILYVDLAGVKEINDEISHEAADKYVIETFKEIATVFRKDDILLARIHTTGDELVVYLPDIEPEDIDLITDRLEQKQNHNPKFYFGFATGSPDSNGHFDFSDIIEEADINQNANKEKIKTNGQR